MIKAVIFDLFGVIVTDGLQTLCDELDQSEPEKVTKIVKLVQASIHGLISSKESNYQIASLFGLSYEEYRTEIARAESRNELLLQYILELRKQYKTGLLSNVSNGGILRRFEQTELDACFDATVASAEVGFAKPEPQIYEIMADRLGVGLDECVFTDDREEYCEGARSVGMQAIKYQSLDQLKHELTKILQQNFE